MRVVADLPRGGRCSRSQTSPFGATRHERDNDDRSRQRPRFLPFPPSRQSETAEPIFALLWQRGLYPTQTPRAFQAVELRFASNRPSKPSGAPRRTPSRTGHSPKPSHTKPIAASARTFPRLHSIRLTWGRLGQADWIQRRICKTPAVVPHPRSEPASVIWSFPHQIKLTFGRRVMRPHHNPACGGQGSRGRDHS